MHLGHWVGAIENWIKLQDSHECFFMVADLHALMGEYENPAKIREYSLEMVMDWLACGIDPDKSTIFVQSHIPEHSELAILLGMMTPLGWLERNPTYKEQLREVEGRDLTSYGFLGYPVLQAGDILLYKANEVPIGEDQLPHLELTREIVRRVKFLYGREVFPEPKALLTKESRLLGTDRRKMSKSYGNAVYLSGDAAEANKKVLSMVTDPERIRVQDLGHPENCNVYTYYTVFANKARCAEVEDWCRGAKKGCMDCKKLLAERLSEVLEPIRARRRELAKRPDYARDVLRAGYQKAKPIAARTIEEMRELLHTVKLSEIGVKP